MKEQSPKTIAFIARNAGFIKLIILAIQVILLIVSVVWGLNIGGILIWLWFVFMMVDTISLNERLNVVERDLAKHIKS